MIHESDTNYEYVSPEGCAPAEMKTIPAPSVRGMVGVSGVAYDVSHAPGFLDWEFWGWNVAHDAASRLPPREWAAWIVATRDVTHSIPTTRTVGYNRDFVRLLGILRRIGADMSGGAQHMRAIENELGVVFCPAEIERLRAQRAGEKHFVHAFLVGKLVDVHAMQLRPAIAAAFTKMLGSRPDLVFGIAGFVRSVSGSGDRKRARAD